VIIGRNGGRGQALTTSDERVGEGLLFLRQRVGTGEVPFLDRKKEV
jgi:hypothetical protein